MTDVPQPDAAPGREPHGPELTLTERELFDRLGWFTQVRWGAALCALAFMAVGWHLFDVRFEWKPAVAVVLTLCMYNLVFSIWSRRLYRRRRIQRSRITTLAHAQILCDVLAVAALVQTIGGVENHFILLFIFPMIVASEFFPSRVAYGYATLAAVLINLIGWGGYFFYEQVHTTLLVCRDGDESVCTPLVLGEAGHHLVFVLQVCFVMTFAVYVAVFIASSIATRLRSREEELEAAYRDLKSLEEIKSQFMRKTSHEMRAPVGAVQSLLKAAAGQMADDAPGRALVQRAVDRSESTLDLIDDLLRYSRLQSAMILDKFDVVDLAALVRESADLFRAQAAEKGIALTIEAAPARVKGVRGRLVDLLNNLVSNAVRYTRAGGRVTIRCGHQSGRCVLAVSDTGIGIAPDEQAHIFEEFFRGEEAKRTVQHGTGLGMTIAKRVVDLHGGRVEVTSAVGQGTTFTVTLPRCVVEE
jgi:signal transduction histidine kinase